MSEHTGGTVTYHRAEYVPDNDTWRVWFRPTGGYYAFGGAEGEAMGLTVPEPAPLVVECRGHRIELSDEEARFFAMYYPANTPHRDHFKRVSGAVKLAGLLRDARQDPQPTADTADAPSDDIDFDALPIGTVLRDKWGDLLLRRAGGWFEGDDDCFLNADDGPFTIVHRPPALSPRQHLEALLAGRDDADELIEYASRHWVSNKPEITHPQYVLTGAVGDAARGGA